MRKSFLKTLPAAALLFGLGSSAGFSQGAGQVIALRYTGLTTTANQIRNIIIDATYPNSPNEVVYLTELNRPTVGDQYGQWVLGFIVPTNSGWYQFATSSDDHSLFWLSTNESPANLQMTAFTAGSSGIGNYNNAGHRCQRSTPIYLEANQPYYFEMLHKEGTGGDGFRIGWQQLYPGGPTNVANSVPGIAGTFLRSAINPGPASLYKPPADVSISDGGTAVFEVQFDGDAPWDYEWFVNGVPQGPQKTYVPRSTLTLAAQTALDDGKIVSVIATNQNGASFTISTNATLRIVADTTPPRLESALGLTATPNTFSLRFSEPVNPASFSEFDITFSSGTTVNVLTQDTTDGSRFDVVTADPLTNGTEVTITTPVTDLVGNGMANLTTTLVLNEGTILYNRFDNIGGGSLNNLLPNANYPFLPAAGDYRSIFEDDPNPNIDNHGTRFRGYVTPDRTGYYYFAVGPDDQAVFFLSTDDSPANARMVAGQAHSQGIRNYNQHPMTRSGPIHLEAGKRYYVETQHGNGTGGDHISVAMRYITTSVPVMENHLSANNLAGNTPGLAGPIPNNTVPISGVQLSPYREAITIDPSHPTDRAIDECSPAETLQVVFLSGTPTPFNMQWYNAANDTPIGDATNAALVLPAPLTNGSYYCVIANDVNTVTSRTATVTVPIYTTGPSIVSAAAFDNNTTVGITFDRTLDLVSSTDQFNYSVVDPVSGTPLAGVASATVLTATANPLLALASPTRYVLQLDTPVTPPFKVKVVNIVDCNGRPLDPAGTEYLVESWGTSINLGLKHPGNANLQATNFPISVGNVDVRVPGTDIWNAEDEFTFIYKQVTGDFDVRVHIPYLDRNANVWAKAGIMARENLTAGSRQLFNCTAEYLAAEEARIALQQRVVANAASSAWPSDPRPFVPRSLAWVRLKREGNMFYGYYSTNGLGWTLAGSYNTSTNLYPQTLYLGLATCGHNTNVNTIAQYRDYGATAYPGAAINIVQQPASVTAPQGAKTSFTVVAELVNAPPNELSYQWQRWDGATGYTNIAGAITDTLRTGFLTVANDNGSIYRVVLKIPGLTVTSADAVLTVEADTVGPKLLYVVGLNPTTAAAFFSEPMHPTDAADPFRWSIDNGAAIINGALNPANPTRVDLTMDAAAPLVAGTLHTLTAGTGNGPVTDASGNATEPNPATASFVAVTDYFVGAVAGNTGGRTTQPDFVTVLPRVNKLPLGALTERGFDCRIVQLTNVFANDNSVTEQVLGGRFLLGSWPGQEPAPNFAGEPEFVETGVINYNVLASSLGRIQPDKPWPGIPNPAYPATGPGNTNYVTMEALTYLDLRKGLYRFGVNSDDGFRVTPATNATDEANATVLGEFNGGRGSADTTFDVEVPEDGLYPIRLIWQQGTGGCNVEFWTYNLLTAQYVAVNDDAGVWAYRAGGGTGPTPPDLGVSLVGSDVVICFPDPGCATCTYTLQSKDDLAAPSWTDEAAAPVMGGGTVCFTVRADQAARFYRVRITP